MVFFEKAAIKQYVQEIKLERHRGNYEIYEIKRNIRAKYAQLNKKFSENVFNKAAKQCGL